MAASEEPKFYIEIVLNDLQRWGHQLAHFHAVFFHISHKSRLSTAIN